MHRLVKKNFHFQKGVESEQGLLPGNNTNATSGRLHIPYPVKHVTQSLRPETDFVVTVRVPFRLRFSRSPVKGRERTPSSARGTVPTCVGVECRKIRRRNITRGWRVLRKGIDGAFRGTNPTRRVGLLPYEERESRRVECLFETPSYDVPSQG